MLGVCRLPYQDVFLMHLSGWLQVVERGGESEVEKAFCAVDLMAWMGRRKSHGPRHTPSHLVSAMSQWIA